MYLDYYGFRKEPFHITPDPQFLYLSPSHKEALGSLIYGLERRKGFVAITGEVGLGKTTVVRALLDRFQRDQIKIIFVFNANVSFLGLLKVIYGEMGVRPPSEDVFEMVQHFYTVLIEEYQQGRNVVLVIDEAQNMPVETLENLRMLSNLETSQDKLLQIFLVGQPELERKLDRTELRQLRQRLAVRAKLAPLTQEESLDYIRHRVAKAGGTTPSIFSPRALLAIARYACGIPRKINILCDNALISGYGYQKRPIPVKIIREVVRDLEGGVRRHPWKWAAVVMVLLALGGGALTAYGHRHSLAAKIAAVTDPLQAWWSAHVGRGAMVREGEGGGVEEPKTAVDAPTEGVGAGLSAGMGGPSGTAAGGETGGSRERVRDTRDSAKGTPAGNATGNAVMTRPAVPTANGLRTGEERKPQGGVTSATEAAVARNEPGPLVSGAKKDHPGSIKEKPVPEELAGRSADPAKATVAKGQEPSPAVAEAQPAVPPGAGRESPDPDHVMDWLLQKRSRKPL